MRTVVVVAATLCLSIVLIAVCQPLIFRAWSTYVWDPSAPIQSMIFDEALLYGLFPFVLLVGTVTTTILVKTKPWAMSMIGTSPVFVGVIILRRFELLSMTLHLIAYTVLCCAIVKVTNSRWIRRVGVTQE